MSQIVARPGLDRTAGFLWQGYRFLPGLWRRYGPGGCEIRLLGERTICLVGAEAAELLYDQRRFRRAGTLPGPVRHTLVGEGGVQGLDGAAHRHRKAMFLRLVTPGGLAALAGSTGGHWQQAVAGWTGRDRTVLFDEAARVLTGAGCEWLGIPLPPAELPTRAAEAVAMVEGFATAGPRHWRGRLARRRSEAWLAGLVRRVRRGDLAAPEDSGLAAVAGQRDPDGGLLDPRTAAVELLNLLRPTVAIAWYVAFAAHALHVHPHWHARLREGDPAERERFVHEVRRFYPFAPAVGARVREGFTWRGYWFPPGRRVLLDVYGTNRDPRHWADPEVFDPDRFAGREVGRYELVPQGGGDPEQGHRCAGEDVTVRLLGESVRVLAGLDYRMPPQDLSIPLDRVPTRPRSGVVLSGVSGLRRLTPEPPAPRPPR